MTRPDQNFDTSRSNFQSNYLALIHQRSMIENSNFELPEGTKPLLMKQSLASNSVDDDGYSLFSKGQGEESRDKYGFPLSIEPQPEHDGSQTIFEPNTPESHQISPVYKHALFAKLTTKKKIQRI